MSPGRTPAVACVRLHPWPLVLLARTSPGVPVAVLNESRRVQHASPDALEAGVQLGMREVAALSRCPELHAEVVSGPTATLTWKELLETLYARYSDRVEGREQGVAFLKVSAPAARDLAAALHAPVGLAGSLEVAQLAALRAKPGELREVAGGEGEQAFLKLSLVEHLTVLGLTAEHVERLRFLGIRGLADLWRWSAGQRESFLGVDVGKRLNRFLRGERTTAVGKYAPGQVLEASLHLDAPIQQPTQADAALADLLPGLVTELRGRSCAYLSVHADTVGGRLSATRKLKWPLDERGLTRVARLALADTHTLPLGVERLTVQLSGLQQPGRMVGLWAGLAELEVTKDVLDRFPEALVKVEWLDPFAYCADAQYQWVDWQTGAVRETPMTPRQTWALPTRTQKHAQAVDRVLAFFEGRDL